MKPMDFRGRRVLVTGASSGLGWEMSKILARDHGAHVVAVARRAAKLEELRQEIESKGGPKVEIIAADLSKLEDVDRVFRDATSSVPLYAAVLNAGVTHFGEHSELTWEGFESMLATNVTCIVRLTTSLVPYLLGRNDGGGILIVSSMTGLVPTPYQTAYSATKAFLVNFGCGLFQELKGKNVSITTSVPGGIATEMTSGERFRTLTGFMMSANDCARSTVEGFRRRAYLHAPGAVTQASASLMGLVPRQFLTGRLAATYRGALEAAKRAGK